MVIMHIRLIQLIEGIKQKAYRKYLFLLTHLIKFKNAELHFNFRPSPNLTSNIKGIQFKRINELLFLLKSSEKPGDSSSKKETPGFSDKFKGKKS